MRQILDDAVPETPQQRRDLLTRVIVAAAKADRELDAQTGGVRAAAGSGHQRADPAGRDDPADGRPDRAHSNRRSRRWPRCTTNSPIPHWLPWPAMSTPPSSGWPSPTRTSPTRANLLARPADRQSGLVDAVRAAESALGPGAHTAGCGGQRRQPTSTARSPPCRRRSPTSRTASRPRETNWRRATSRTSDELGAARDAAVRAVADAQSNGTADPLGAFTKLTQADAELDRLLASVAEEREAAERLSRAFDQALFAAQSEVRAVSDFIDIRRGSIGSGGAHPARRSGAPTAGRAGQAREQSQRGDRARERRGDAGVAGAVDGQRRRAGRAARIHRALRRHRRIQHGRGARRHHPRQHPQRRRDGRRHRRQAWAAAGARRHTAGPARAAGLAAVAAASRGHVPSPCVSEPHTVHTEFAHVTRVQAWQMLDVDASVRASSQARTT